MTKPMGNKQRDMYCGSYGKRDAYLVEVPPMVVRTSMRSHRQRYSSSSRNESTEIMLPLPWCYYTVVFYKYRSSSSSRSHIRRVASLLGRPEPVVDDDDLLFYLPLPNFYSKSLTFCSNVATPSTLSDKVPIEHHINMAIAEHWGSKFTYIRRDGELPWKHLFEDAGLKWEVQTPSTMRAYTAGNFVDLYRHWASKSIDEILLFPWGQRNVGTIKDLLMSDFFGSEQYVYDVY